MSTSLRFLAPHLRLVAVLGLVALLGVACSDSDDDNVVEQPATSEPADEGGESADGDSEGSSVAESGLLMTDDLVRFSQLDWAVLGTELRPDGPGDDGEDADSEEEFLYVELEVTSPIPELGLEVPVEWVGVVDADGTLHRATSTDDAYESRILVEPGGSVDATLVIPIEAGTSLEGGWIQLDQEGRLAAALGGPQLVDEAARSPVTFNTTTYQGPMSRDSATVEILEAYWSRELGVDSDGAPLETAEPRTFRPAEDHVFLIVHYEITGEQDGADTGGVNHRAGLVVVDGEGALGEGTSDGLVDYGETEDAWAVYEVPIDAESVSVAICDCQALDEGGQTNFVVTDLDPLEELATPEQ